LAAGERLDQVLPADITPRGHAIEVRVYAEDPKRFLPSPGPLRVFRPPSGAGIRVETGYAEGNTVTPFYDPMLAKLIAHGATRQQAISRMEDALAMFAVEGVKTNIAFARQVLADEAFRAGAIHTGLAADVLARPAIQQS
jgi:acetyl-CoA carboxylase biotin carboxylase subunit